MSDLNFFLAKRLLREFERSELYFISSLEDLDLVWAIGYAQQIGRPIGLKELSTGEFGSAKTVQRRVERLIRLSIIERERSDCDGRCIMLTLTDSTLRRLAKYKCFIIQNGMESRDPSLHKAA